MTADPTFWDNIAQKYARQPVDRPDAFDRKIDITRSRMTSQSTVLDIGCGTGSLALRLASAGSEIHGLDLSSEMIRIAREKAAAQGVDNVTFHVGPFDDDFRAFEEGSLDGICAYSILHLLEDRSAALAQIHRLLAPGGFFISSTVCLGDSWIPYPLILKVMRWMGKAPLVRTISRQSLVKEIEEAGFVDVEQPDVGAQPTVAFIVATKPEDRSPRSSAQAGRHARI